MIFFTIKYDKDSGRIHRYDKSYFFHIFILAITLVAIVTAGPSLENAVRFIVDGSDYSIYETVGLLDWVWQNTGWRMLIGMFVVSFIMLRKANLRSSFYDSIIAISIVLTINDIVLKLPEITGGYLVSTIVINLIGAVILSSLMMIIRFNQDKNVFKLVTEMPFASIFYITFPFIIGVLICTVSFFISNLFFAIPIADIKATIISPFTATYEVVADKKKALENFAAFSDIKLAPSHLELSGKSNIEIAWTNTEYYGVLTEIFFLEGCYFEDRKKLIEHVMTSNNSGTNFAEQLQSFSLDEGELKFSIDSEIASFKSEFKNGLKYFDIIPTGSNDELEVGVYLDSDDVVFHSPISGTTYYSMSALAFDSKKRMQRSLKVITEQGTFDFIFVPKTDLTSYKKEICRVIPFNGEPGVNRVDLSGADFSVILSVKSKEVLLQMAANSYGTARIMGSGIRRLVAPKLSKPLALNVLHSGALSYILTNGFSKIFINGEVVSDFDASDSFFIKGDLKLNVGSDEMSLQGKVESMDKEKHRFSKTRWEKISPQIGGFGTIISFALSLAPLGWFFSFFVAIWRSNYVIGTASDTSRVGDETSP